VVKIFEVLKAAGFAIIAVRMKDNKWVRLLAYVTGMVKQECLSKLILFGDGALRRGLTEYLAYYHGERNHQGKGNLLLFPAKNEVWSGTKSTLRCRKRLGGLLNYYSRAA